MPYDPEKHQRRSIRLKGYDYTQVGAYFVTLCIYKRECLLGKIVDGVMQLSPLGQIVEKEWLRTALVRPNVKLDAFTIMPNHIHGIIVLLNNPEATAYNGNLPGKTALVEGYVHTGCPQRPNGPVSGSLGAIIGQFKSLSTKRINRVRKTPGVAIWQRNFHDHIIRHEEALHAIRQYIVENPCHWTDDPVNPRYPVPNEHPLTNLPF